MKRCILSGLGKLCDECNEHVEEDIPSTSSSLDNFNDDVNLPGTSAAALSAHTVAMHLLNLHTEESFNQYGGSLPDDDDVLGQLPRQQDSVSENYRDVGDSNPYSRAFVNQNGGRSNQHGVLKAIYWKN